MADDAAKVKDKHEPVAAVPADRTKAAHTEASLNSAAEVYSGKPSTTKLEGSVVKTDVKVPAATDKVLPKLDLVESAPALDQKTIDSHAKELHDAITRRKWVGLKADPDQEKIERVLGPLSQADRAALEKSYDRQFGNGESGFLRKELKEKLSSVDATKAETILNRADGRTNDAGAVKLALTEMADNPAKGNAELARVLKGLNSEQLTQLKADYQRDYGTSFEQAMANNPKVSQAIRDSLPELTKGSDLRSAADVGRMAENALKAGDRELFTSFISGESPAAVQARTELLAKPGFRESLASAFPSKLYYDSLEYGASDGLTTEQKTDQVILDYMNKGHVGLDTIAKANTGMWIFNNKENIELAVKNATPDEREKFALGQKLSESGAAKTPAEKEAVEFYTTLNKALSDGSSPRETQLYKDNLINGRPTIISEMAKAHSEGWDPFGWSSGHKRENLFSKVEGLTQEDWAKLKDPTKGAEFRKQIEDSLKTYADPLEREQIMKMLDNKAKAATFEESKLISRSLTEAISDNTGSKFLGMGTSYDTAKITERIAGMSAEDAARYKNDADYRKQINDFVNTNMNATEKLYSTRLLAQVEQSGLPPKENAIDKVLANSIKTTDAEVRIRDIEKALADPQLRERLNKDDKSLTPEDRQLKQVIESQAFSLVSGKIPGDPENPSYQIDLANQVSHELLTTGKLSPATKLDFGFKRSDVLPELGRATEAERASAERYLNPQEKQIVENLVKQNGEATLADRLRTFVVTGGGDFKDFQPDLEKLTNAQKQELKDEYSRKYGGALNEDFLSRVKGEQGEKNIYRQYLTPSDSDGRQDLYDNYAKLLESRSGFSADGTVLTAERANELHADALERYNREFKKLNPEQQKAMNEFFGQSMEQYKGSKEKLAEILTDATITAAALAAAPFTAGLSTAALLTVIGSAAAAGATYRVAMFKTIQGNDFDSSAQNVLKQGLLGASTAALNFVGPELFVVSGRFASVAGTNIAKELAATTVSSSLREGAEKILATEVKELAAKRGFAKLTEEELGTLVNKVAKPGASEADRLALRETLERSANSNLERAATQTSEELVKKGALGRQMVENAAVGAGANVGSELIIAPFNKDGIDWNNIQQGAWTGLAMGAVMPMAFRAVSHIGGGMKTAYTHVTKGPDGAYIDPKSITEPISFRSTTTGEIRTIKPNEGEPFKLTNDWQPEAGGRSVNDDVRFSRLADAQPELMARSDQPFTSYQAQDYSLRIAGQDRAITGDTVFLGRASEADVVLNASTVSRQHAVMEFKGGQPTITDLNSTYGTFVNGKKLSPSEVVALKPGDQIQLGRDKPFTFGVKPEFHLDLAGTAIDLKNGQTILGRSSTSDVQISSDVVSGRHAKIETTPQGPTITDLGSSNGTFINGVKIEANKPVLLQPGDTIRLSKEGPTYKVGKGNENVALPRQIHEVAPLERQPRQVMEYKPGSKVDNAARPEAVQQSNSYKKDGEVRGRIEDGFQSLTGDAPIRADGKWNDPHRPSLVVDRTQDTVLNDAISEAHRRFDHLRDDPAKLASELAKYSKTLMEPKGWSSSMVDSSYTAFREVNRGKRILLGDYIARAAREEGAGVCQHEALLMKVLGDDFKLDISVVSGFYGAKPKGGFPRETFGNHVWNEVHIDGQTYIYDPRQQKFALRAEDAPKHNPARAWLRGADAAPVERPVTLDLKPGQNVSYEGSTRWQVSSRTPEVRGNYVLEAPAVKPVSPESLRELNGNRPAVIGESYKVRRSDGSVEDGWVLKGTGRDGNYNLYKDKGMTIEVSPKEIARQNPDLNDHFKAPTDSELERILPRTQPIELKPEDILSPTAISRVSREISDRMREVPITSSQFDSMFEGLNAQQRKIAIEMLEKSTPNLNSRALDAQLADLGSQIDHNGSVTIYTLGGDSSGNPLAYLFRKNNPNINVEIKILDAQALSQMGGRTPNESALIFDDLSKATAEQKRFLGTRNNLAVADLGGFDKGVNLWDFGASKYAGTELMRGKIQGLVAEAEGRMARNPNLTLDQAIDQTLNPLTSTQIRDINPRAKVLKPAESFDASEMRDLRRDLGSDREHIRELYNEVTGPLIGQQEIERYLGSLDVQRQAAAAMVLRDGIHVNTYSNMMEQMRGVQSQILERAAARPEDIIIMHSFDKDGSAYLVNSLYARVNGLKPEQFMSIDQIRAVDKGALKGKVLVYLDDVTYSGKQAADNIRLNANDLQKSGARVAVGTLGAYDVPADQNYWTMYNRNSSLDYQQLRRLNPMVVSGQRYSDFYSPNNPLMSQFRDNPLLLQQTAGTSDWSKSSVNSAIILPYGGPNNNIALLSRLMRQARMPGTK